FPTDCTCLSSYSSSFSLEVVRYICDKTLNNLHRPSAAISLVSNDRFGFITNPFPRSLVGKRNAGCPMSE
ncbi:MAG: hypothetical protein SOX84_04625, partial [Prevotella sp.]|nr:hypothetical protein [Prevotella sp.]